jgi:hypothetical protein
MTATIKLTPNTIHCVKTGIALASLAGSPEDGLGILNSLLSSGRVEAGTNPGHVRLSKAERARITAMGHSLKQYRWASYNRSEGEWKQYAGWHIGQHNIAVLTAHGYSADPSTLSKGKTCDRKYGVYAAPKPKAPKANTVLDYSSLGTEPEIVSVMAEPVTVVPHNLDVRDFLPTEGELTAGKSSYVIYKKRAMAMGASSKQATAAWNAGRKAMGTQSKAPAKVAPEVKAPIVGQSSSTIRVTPEALQATLAALQGATIGGFDGTAFTVTYGA